MFSAHSAIYVSVSELLSFHWTYSSVMIVFHHRYFLEHTKKPIENHSMFVQDVVFDKIFEQFYIQTSQVTSLYTACTFWTFTRIKTFFVVIGVLIRPCTTTLTSLGYTTLAHRPSLKIRPVSLAVITSWRLKCLWVALFFSLFKATLHYVASSC